MTSYVDQIIKVTNSNSKFYEWPALVSYETEKMLNCISFEDKPKFSCKKYTSEVLISSRPFVTFRIHKKSVKIIAEKTIKPTFLKRARSQAFDEVFGYKTNKPYLKNTKITITHQCDHFKK
jgi:hypothetical protein